MVTAEEMVDISVYIGKSPELGKPFREWVSWLVSRNRRDTILHPRSSRITPRGEPTAKKFCTGNKRTGVFLSIAVGIRFSSSIEIVCCSWEKRRGWILRISNASKDYLVDYNDDK